MTALLIGVGTLGLGLGAFIGVTQADRHEETVGYGSLVLVGAGLFAFGFGLARVLA